MEVFSILNRGCIRQHDTPHGKRRYGYFCAMFLSRKVEAVELSCANITVDAHRPHYNNNKSTFVLGNTPYCLLIVHVFHYSI